MDDLKHPMQVIHRIGGLERGQLLLEQVGLVIHRIGGLESSVETIHQSVVVIHRIGGLENPPSPCLHIITVIHRIGGLEKNRLCCTQYVCCYTPHRWLRKPIGAVFMYDEWLYTA